MSTFGFSKCGIPIAKYGADRNWQKHAELHGFSSEAEMLPLLYESMSLSTIVGLFDVTSFAIIDIV